MNKSSLSKQKTNKEDRGTQVEMKGHYTIFSKNVEGQSMDDRIKTSIMLHEDGSKFMLNVAVVPESHRDKIKNYFVLDNEDLGIVKDYAEKEGVEKAVEVLKDLRSFCEFYPSKKAYVREMELAPDTPLFFIYELLDVLPMLSARQGEMISQEKMDDYYEEHKSEELIYATGMTSLLEAEGIPKELITFVPDFIACRSRKEAFQSSEILPIYTLTPRARKVIYSEHGVLQIFRKIYCGIPWEMEQCQSEQFRTNLSSVQKVMKTLSPEGKEGMLFVEDLESLISGMENYDWSIPDLETPFPDHRFSSLAATDKISIDTFRDICDYYSLPAYASFLWKKDEKMDEIAVWEARVLLTTGWIQKSTFPDNMKDMMRYQLARLQPDAGVQRMLRLFLKQFQHKNEPVRLLGPIETKAFEERQKRNEILQQRKMAKKGKDAKIFKEEKKLAEEIKNKNRLENELWRALADPRRASDGFGLAEVEEEYHGRKDHGDRSKKLGEKVLKLAKKVDFEVLTSSVEPTSSSFALSDSDDIPLKPTFTGDLELTSSETPESENPLFTSSAPPDSPPLRHSCSTSSNTSEILDSDDTTPSTPIPESISDDVTSSDSEAKSRRIDERLVEMGKRLESMGKELSKEKSEKKKMEKEKNQEIKKRDREIEKGKSAKSKLSDASDAMKEELQQYKRAQEKIDKDALDFSKIEANLKRVQEENLHLQEKINMMSREMKLLENNAKKHQNTPEPSDLSRSLQKAKLEISNLKSENEMLKENLVIEDVKYAGLDALLQKERARSAELEEKLENVEKCETVEKKSGRKCEEKSEDKVSEMLAESEVKEERLKTVNLRLMERINAQQKEIDELKNSLEKMEKEKASTSPQVGTSETLNALEQSQTQISELKQEIGSLNEEVDLLRGKTFQFEMRAVEMEEQLQIEKNKNHRLMEEIDEMRKNSMNCENQKLQILTSEIEKLQTLIKSQEDVIENLKRLNVDEINKNIKLKQDIEDLKKDFRDDKIKNMNDGHNLYKRSCEENERLKQEIAHLKNSEVSIREYNKRISAENLHQKDQISQLEKSKFYGEDLIGQQRKQISDLTNKMGTMTRDIKILTSNLEFVQEEKRELMDKNHESQESKRRLEVLTEQIEKQKRQETLNTAELQQKIKNLESHNRYLESELRHPNQQLFQNSEIQEKLHRLEIQNQQQEATIRMLSQIVAKDSTVPSRTSCTPTTVLSPQTPPTFPTPPTQSPQFFPAPRCFVCQKEINRNQETLDCQNCRKSSHKRCGMRLIDDNHPCFCCGKLMDK